MTDCLQADRFNISTTGLLATTQRLNDLFPSNNPSNNPTGAVWTMLDVETSVKPTGALAIMLCLVATSETAEGVRENATH